MNSHFVLSYESHVKDAVSRLGRKQGMEQAVGGDYKSTGILQRNLLVQHGLTPQSSLVDIGCGSGRLAFALRDFQQLKYLGTDIIEDLLAYARTLVKRPDWKFVKSTDLRIPASDNSTDFACAFSVFTHLLHEETYIYLQEIRRVLRPGGRLIFSFLDFAVPAHWTVFETNVANVSGRSVLNQFMDHKTIQVWCEHLNLRVVALHHGYEPYITLPEPVQLDNGTVLTQNASMGQSICVVDKV